jgi:RNA polymerase subunit RPABC4/transcription elongation factor Spt4
MDEDKRTPCKNCTLLLGEGQVECPGCANRYNTTRNDAALLAALRKTKAVGKHQQLVNPVGLVAAERLQELILEANVRKHKMKAARSALKEK